MSLTKEDIVAQFKIRLGEAPRRVIRAPRRVKRFREQTE